MKWNLKTGETCILVVLMSVFYAEGHTHINTYDHTYFQKEFQITASGSSQEKPAIYGDIVVWEDDRNGNYDIYGYNLSTQKEFQITTSESNQKEPAIYGDIVVWTEWRTDYNFTIFGYNLFMKEEFNIKTDQEYPWEPAIYGDIVVYVDWSNFDLDNGDINVYNFSTQEKFQITSDESHQEEPAIYEDIVVWPDDRNGNYDIYGYNLSTQREFQITENESSQWSPAIYGDIVVWEDDRSGNYDIYGYNLSTQDEFKITVSKSGQRSPAIYGDIVVWQDDRNGNYDIYGYNLSTQKEFQITTSESNQKEPAIYGDIVVWQDDRNGNYDIYGYNLSTLDKDGDGSSILEDCNDNDEETGKCKGNLIVVVSSGGKGLTARVYINGLNKGETDSEGKITVYDLDMGKTYTIRVEAEGYKPEEKKAKIEEDETQIEFKMGEKDEENYIFPLGVSLLSIIAIILFIIFRPRNRMKKEDFEPKKGEKKDVTNEKKREALKVNETFIEKKEKQAEKYSSREKERKETRAFEFDIAISFAGEDRHIAENLARALRAGGVKVFYDNLYKYDLWGKDLRVYFQGIYGPKARFVLLLISKHYPIKDWTDFEFSIMRNEAKRRNKEFILPVKLDDTKMIGVRESIAYLDYRREGIDGIVECLFKKLSQELPD